MILQDEFHEISLDSLCFLFFISRLFVINQQHNIEMNWTNTNLDSLNDCITFFGPACSVCECFYADFEFSRSNHSVGKWKTM